MLLFLHILQAFQLLTTAGGAEVDRKTLCKGYDARLEKHVKLCPSETNDHTECDLICDDDDICFTLYTNKSGDTKVQMKNCWKNGDENEGDEIDVCDHEGGVCWKGSNTIMVDDFYQCKCCGSFCNVRNLTMVEVQNIVIERKSYPTPGQKLIDEGTDAQVGVIAGVFAVVAGIILSLAIICACMVRKRSKHNMLHGSDKTSVETPESCDTHTTPINENDHGSMSKLDFNLPELAELKARGQFGCDWIDESPGQDSPDKIFLMQQMTSAGDNFGSGERIDSPSTMYDPTTVSCNMKNLEVGSGIRPPPSSPCDSSESSFIIADTDFEIRAPPSSPVGGECILRDEDPCTEQ